MFCTATHYQLCTPDMTEVKQEAIGDTILSASHSLPQVRMLNGAAALVSYERTNIDGGGRGENAPTIQETRVWEVHDGRWRCVHHHSSLE